MSAPPPVFAEQYSNALYCGHPCYRYWVKGAPILVGGSLLSADDLRHLESKYGVTHVINAETEHGDEGKVPSGRLLQVQVPDDGSPFPANKVLSACLFAARASLHSTPSSRVCFYVHCQMGGSRSPAFAYALLRGVYGLGPEEAFSAVREARGGDYGEHAFHKSYFASIEAALATSFGQV